MPQIPSDSQSPPHVCPLCHRWVVNGAGLSGSAVLTDVLGVAHSLFFSDTIFEVQGSSSLAVNRFKTYSL